MRKIPLRNSLQRSVIPFSHFVPIPHSSISDGSLSTPSTPFISCATPHLFYIPANNRSVSHPSSNLPPLSPPQPFPQTPPTRAQKQNFVAVCQYQISRNLKSQMKNTLDCPLRNKYLRKPRIAGKRRSKKIMGKRERGRRIKRRRVLVRVFRV